MEDIKIALSSNQKVNYVQKYCHLMMHIKNYLTGIASGLAQKINPI